MSDKRIGTLTVSELKNIIKECLREIAEENQFTETQYKQIWIKPPIITDDGFKCGD